MKVVKETKKKLRGRKVITIVKETKPLSEYKDYGSFHGKHIINLPNCILTIAGCITGCGLAQLYGVSTMPSTITKEQFINALAPRKKCGVGAVICTLGQTFYTHESKLLNLGFEKMSEYNNYRHGSSYTQRMYLLKL